MSDWTPVNKAAPCPACGKPDWCVWTPDQQTLLCKRGGTTPAGFRLLKPDSGGGSIFARDDGRGGPRGNGSPVRRPKPGPTRPGGPPAKAGLDLEAALQGFRAKMLPERLEALAKATGLPADAWAKLGPGWCAADDLRELRASGAGWPEDYPAGAWCFPEHDGAGRLVGFSLRAEDGRKGGPAGSTGAKRGLIVPANLSELPEPVLVVEGASDVAAAISLGLAAVGRSSNRAGAADLADLLDGLDVLVVGENDQKDGGAWPGRDGAKAVAKQLAGRLGEPVAWTLPPEKIKDLRAWVVANPGGSSAGLLEALRTRAKEAKAEKRSQADGLVDLALEQYRLGMTAEREAFAVERNGPAVALLFRGGASALRAKLAKQYRERTGKTPSASALADALTALEGQALDAEPEPVYLRVAEHEGGIVLDLGASGASGGGRVVVVTPDGWQMVDPSPVLFRRTALSAVLPEPAAITDPAALLELRQLLNVSDDTWPLVVGWLVAACIATLPHPVVMFSGLQGTGKSTAARFMVGLVDPSEADLRSDPRDPEQWAIAAAGSWLVAIDNVSHLSTWFSDALCKAVTGDGWIRRKLYTDGDLAVLAFRRCVLMTSIDPGALRGDLADRLLLIDLEPIPEDQRRTEAELNAAYGQARPRLLAGLLAALARTLAALPAVKLTKLPRMADFAVVLAALDTACPELTGGRALALFEGQRGRIAGEVVEADDVALAVVKLMERQESWAGTAAQLLAAIAPTPAPKDWPKNGRALSGRLKRLQPALLVVGVRHVAPVASDKTRTHRLERAGGKPPEPPIPPEGGDSQPEAHFPHGLYSGGREPGPGQPPADRPAENGDFQPAGGALGDSGGMGGTEPLSSGDGRERGEL